jgi:hypothetical protein
MVKVDVDTGFGSVESTKMWPIRAREILEAVDQYQLGDSEKIGNAVANNILRIR